MEKYAVQVVGMLIKINVRPMKYVDGRKAANKRTLFPFPRVSSNLCIFE